MSKYKDLVPAEFWSGNTKPKAFTVGELIEQLQRIPHEIEISSGFSPGVGLCLYNVDRDEMHLEFLGFRIFRWTERCATQQMTD